MRASDRRVRAPSAERGKIEGESEQREKERSQHTAVPLCRRMQEALCSCLGRVR